MMLKELVDLSYLINALCGMNAALATWQQVIELLKDNAAIKQQQKMHDDSIREIQLHGSPVVQRVDAKLEILAKGQEDIKQAIKEKFNVKIL